MTNELLTAAWQAIDTAPRDGTWLLLAGGTCVDDEADDGRQVIGQWTTLLNGSESARHGRWQFAWYDGGYYGEYRQPTHWMPLPG